MIFYDLFCEGPSGLHIYASTAVKRLIRLNTYTQVFDPTYAADASSYELGATLMQKHNSSWKPVAYSSRSTTSLCSD